MQVLKDLVGHPWDGNSEKMVLSFAGDHIVRVVNKYECMTCDFVEGRITVIVENDGSVWDVQQDKNGNLQRCL